MNQGLVKTPKEFISKALENYGSALEEAHKACAKAMEIASKEIVTVYRFYVWPIKMSRLEQINKYSWLGQYNLNIYYPEIISSEQCSMLYYTTGKYEELRAMIECGNDIYLSSEQAKWLVKWLVKWNKV